MEDKEKERGRRRGIKGWIGGCRELVKGGIKEQMKGGMKGREDDWNERSMQLRAACCVVDFAALCFSCIKQGSD